MTEAENAAEEAEEDPPGLISTVRDVHNTPVSELVEGASETRDLIDRVLGGGLLTVAAFNASI